MSYDGRFHYYAHLKTINTKVGKLVEQDEFIGKVGRTGNASRVGWPPHLHYSIFSIIP